MKFPEMLTGVQHIGVPTNDLEKTVAFYETIGFQPVLETVNEAANERVTFLQLKNLVIETYENHAAVGKPGAIDHIALDTTDVEAAFAAAKEAGAYDARRRDSRAAVLGERREVFHRGRSER